MGFRNGNPLQYSCLENPMDGGAWWATVHGVAKSWTRLSDFTFTFHSLFYKFKLQKIPKVTHNKKNANSYYEILILSYQFSSVQSLSRVQLFVTPWTVAHQAPPSMGFSRQESGVGCHFLLQGISPTQGSNPGLLHYRQMLYHLSDHGSPIPI